MKKRIFIYIITLQAILIVGIIFQIREKKTIVITNTLYTERVEPDLVPGLKTFYEPIPDADIKVNLSWMGNGYDYFITNKINSDGFNQIDDFPVKKDKNVFRIVTLGDSFTFGVNVNTEENYPSVLQKIVNQSCNSSKRIEVLNLGVSGYDTQYNVERLKLRGMKYQPDLLLWFIVVDDLDRIIRLSSSKSQDLHKQLMSTYNGRLILKKSPYANIAMATRAVVDELGEQKVLSMQKSYLNTMIAFYKNPLVFFTYANNKTSNEHKEFLKSYVSDHKNAYFDDKITDIYSKNGVLPDLHPNSLGYKIMANDVFNYLKSSKLIPCN